MSTYTGVSKTQVLDSEEALKSYFRSFIKAEECIRVGLEVEFFAVDSRTGKAYPYEGEQSIHSILKLLVDRFHYEPIFEGDAIVALRRGALMVTLEPGGQVELSAPPVENVFEIQEQIRIFLTELKAAREAFPGLTWITAGMQPFSTVEEMQWVPKKRYQIMGNFLKQRGEWAHEMMLLTGTNQINFDYLSEENAMENLKTALGLSSVISAMFSNSSFSGGRPNGYQTKRIAIWDRTDPARTGLLLDFIQEGRNFKDYLDYILEVPMMFVVREGKWIQIPPMSFRQFIQKGYEGFTATLGDFELHLSTAFPEVRLKQYLEIRGVDCQHPCIIPAVAALWKGILYRPAACREAWALVKNFSREDRIKLHQEIPRQGLKAKLGKVPVVEIARELITIACRSLSEQKPKDLEHDECVFLPRLKQYIIEPQKTPADRLLEFWNASSRTPAELVNYLNAEQQCEEF